MALLRPGLEVLLLGRPQTASFAAGAHVFPGGSVDPEDRGPEWLQHAGRDERVPVAMAAAAIREAFEECGIALARTGDGAEPDRQALTHLAAWRRSQPRGPFSAALREAGLVPDLAGLRYAAHWVTPPGVPRRFDTRFFVAAAPPGQIPSLLGAEHADLAWVAPAGALARARAGEWQLLPPTRAILERLAAAGTLEQALERAYWGEITTVVPGLDQITEERYPGLDLSIIRDSGG